MDQKKIKIVIIAILGLAALGIIMWQLVKYFNRKSAEKQLPESNQTVQNLGGSPTFQTETFPLKKGSRGEKTKTVQSYINKNLALFGLSETSPLVVDGIFGDKTTLYVNAYKKFRFLPQDGTITESEYNNWILPMYNLPANSGTISTGGTWG